MTEAVYSHADLLAAEKQQLRLLIEQQQKSNLHSSSYASYAPPFPIISLADDWQLNVSPQPPAVSSTTDDYFTNYLSDDVANSKLHHSSFPHYSATSDYYPTAQLPTSPSTPSTYNDKLASYEPPLTASLKRTHHQSSVSDELPPSKRLTVELPVSSYSHLKKAGGPHNAVLQAQYPLLSSELVDGFFASNVNVSSGVMGGLDDSELGLTSTSRQASDISFSEKIKLKEEPIEEQVVLPSGGETSRLPKLLLELQTSAHSQASTGSSSAPVSPFEPSTFSSSPTSPVSSSLLNPSSLSNRMLPSDHRGEGQRRMKRRLTDKQRRAKIKDGLEHLRSLVALHGNASSDQASIVNSSVDLVQQLVNEREDLKHQLRKAGDERVEIEREQQIAIDKQRLAAVLPAPLPSSTAAVSADKAASPDLSVLLHHLSNILTPVLGAGRGESEAQAPAAAGPVGGLEHLVLSQYFLHTLKLLTNLPRNNAV